MLIGLFVQLAEEGFVGVRDKANNVEEGTETKVESQNFEKLESEKIDYIFKTSFGLAQWKKSADLINGFI